MCLNENYNRVRVDKHLSDTFPIKNKRLFFIFALDNTIKSVQVNKDGLTFNGTDQL